MNTYIKVKYYSIYSLFDVPVNINRLHCVIYPKQYMIRHKKGYSCRRAMPQYNRSIRFYFEMLTHKLRIEHLDSFNHKYMMTAKQKKKPPVTLNVLIYRQANNSICWLHGLNFNCMPLSVLCFLMNIRCLLNWRQQQKTIQKILLKCWLFSIKNGSWD